MTIFTAFFRKKINIPPTGAIQPGSLLHLWIFAPDAAKSSIVGLRVPLV
jgi:hypothetical protein